jgi:hypothetical protein
MKVAVKCVPVAVVNISLMIPAANDPLVHLTATGEHAIGQTTL